MLPVQMVTPPSSPRAALRSSSPVPCRRSTRQVSTPFITPEVLILGTKLTPPAPPVPSRKRLMEAMLNRDCHKVRALIEDDPTLALQPIIAGGLKEDPLFYALRNKCPEAIIKVLLPSGHATIQKLATESLIFVAKLDRGLSERELRTAAFAVPLLPCSTRRSFFDPEPPSTQIQNVPLGGIKQNTDDDDYELSVASYMLRCGANPFKTDAHGMSAVQYALRERKSGLAELCENWHQWQQCRLQFHLGILPFSSTMAENVYRFLVPESWQLAAPSRT